MADTAHKNARRTGSTHAAKRSADERAWGPGSKQGRANRSSAERHEMDIFEPSKEVLDQLIEAEIIPRLMLAHGEGASGPAPVIALQVPRAGFTAGDVDRFARSAVDADPDTVVNEVMVLLAEGVSHEDIFLRLLAPAARRLGEYWEEDSANFTDVTLGLMKLQRVLECVNADAPVGMGASANAPSVLITLAPGEQHVFGAVMVGEFFARSGWNVRCEPLAESAHLVDTLSEKHFDVIGISASTDVNAKKVRALIDQMRTASRNPAVVVMVGGPTFNKDPALARRVGADAMATDGVRAVVTAERLTNSLKCAQEAPKH